MRILLVDDDERVLSGMARLVRALGHESAQATSVSDARAALSAREFDLVLSDMWLSSGESGLDLLAWLGRERPQVRFVLASGAACPPGLDLDPPRRAFLHKPFGLDELARVLA